MREGEVNEEPEAGVEDQEEHGRRLIVADLEGSPLSSNGLSTPQAPKTRGDRVPNGYRARARRLYSSSPIGSSLDLEVSTNGNSDASGQTNRV